MGSDISSSMKTAALVLAFALGVSADGLGGHSHAHAPVRRGRQEEAPLDAYAQPGYEGDLDSAASDVADPLAMLQGAIPGVPGEDYPIYAEVPETGFACDGQVDGGYYADGEAECQVFHICTADGAGGLSKYSFLCPNGTIFNQNYFICDWWLTLTVLKLKAFSLSMMTLLLNVLKLMPLPLRPLPLMMLQLLMLPLLMLIMTLPPLLNMVLPKKFVLLGRDHSTAGTAEDRRVRSDLPSHLSRPCCISSQCNVTTSAILSSLSSLRIVFHFLGCFIHFTVIFIVTYDMCKSRDTKI